MPKRQKNNFIGIQGLVMLALLMLLMLFGKNLANYRIICFEKKENFKNF